MLQYFPNITGSLQVTGSVSVSGSITATGGITISGSIDSASFATTASFASTASSADNFFVRQNVTASNMLATGRITAQTLVVQTVTSSIVYSSGSNIFGNLPSIDVQQFTGSLRVTGSGNHWIVGNNLGVGTSNPTSILHVSQSGTNLATFEGATAAPYIQVKGTSSPYLQFLSSSTEVGYIQGSCTGISLGWGGSFKVFVSGSGNVGIGTSTPVYRLDVQGGNVNFGGTVNITNLNRLQWNGGDIAIVNTGSYDMAFLTYTGAALTEKMRISGSGNVGIGTPTPAFLLDISGSATNPNGGTLRIFAGASDASLRFGTTGSYSWIQAHGSKPLYINEIGNNTILNLTSGNVGIGTCSPVGSNKLTILMDGSTNATGLAIKAVNDGGGGSQPAINFVNGTGNNIAQIVADNGTGYIAFNTSGSNTERLRITTSGIASFTCQVCTPVTIITGCATIGASSAPTSTLDITRSSPDPFNTVQCQLSLINGGGNGGAGSQLNFNIGGAIPFIRGLVDGANSNSGAALVFGTTTSNSAGTERMRITSTGNVGIGNTAPSYQLDMCSGTTVNQRIRLQRGSDDTNQNMLLGWNNIVVTRSNVSISSNQTDFSLIQCGSDGARVPFYIGIGGHACFACAVCFQTHAFPAAGGYIRSTGGNLVQWQQMCASSGTMNINLQGNGLAVSGNYPVTNFWVQAGLFPGSNNVLLNISVVANSGGNYTCSIISATCVLGGIGTFSIQPYHSNTAPGVFCVVLTSSCGTAVYWNAFGFAAST